MRLFPFGSGIWFPSVSQDDDEQDGKGCDAGQHDADLGEVAAGEVVERHGACCEYGDQEVVCGEPDSFLLVLEKVFRMLRAASPKMAAMPIRNIG